MRCRQAAFLFVKKSKIIAYDLLYVKIGDALVEPFNEGGGKIRKESNEEGRRALENESPMLWNLCPRGSTHL